jgi:hypothetical protein
VIKFLHLLSMLAFVSLFMVASFLRQKKRMPVQVACRQLKTVTAALLVSLLVSVVLGAALVHQKGYFFSTPWIQAALLLSFVLFCLILAIFYLQRKRIVNPEFVRLDKLRLLVLQLFSFGIIVAIVHDAVTKTTGVL